MTNCTWVILSLFVGPGRIVEVSAEVEFCSLLVCGFHEERRLLGYWKGC